jgi:hypothetical protein
VWERDKYEALFADAPPGTLLGESTSLYLQDPDALRRIRTAVPDVRIIALLRDPVDRAHSNWAHLWSAGLEPEHDFVKACLLEQRRTAAGWAPFWRYLSLGKYGEQLDQLWTLFPREQTLVLRYRELRESPAETLDLITGFSRCPTGGDRDDGRERDDPRLALAGQPVVARVLRPARPWSRSCPVRSPAAWDPSTGSCPAICSASNGCASHSPPSSAAR